jgi:hypothetical protein
MFFTSNPTTKGRTMFEELDNMEVVHDRIDEAISRSHDVIEKLLAIRKITSTRIDTLNSYIEEMADEAESQRDTLNIIHTAKKRSGVENIDD